MSSEKQMNMHQGHWVLAKLGKKVLRPGGRELTNQMIAALNIGTDDVVVEFAPGLGYTARLTCTHNPKTYTAVEINEEAADIVKKNVTYAASKIVIGSAQSTGLPENCASKVYGEAMLTMQSDSQKNEIIAEAARLLRQGGLYGIHEVGITPDDIDEKLKIEIRKDLASSIMTNVRPLTMKEWSDLLEANGFEVIWSANSGMFLLEFKRMIADEGFSGFLKIAFNLLTGPSEYRKQVIKMRKMFRKHKEHINAISIVARKK